MRLVAHAFAIWVACALTIAGGRRIVGMGATLWIHAGVAPIAAALVSSAYFNHARAASPLAAATFFAAFALLLDATLVGVVIEKSYAMFASLLGTWVPLLSIFAATYCVGDCRVHHGLRRAYED